VHDSDNDHVKKMTQARREQEQEQEEAISIRQTGIKFDYQNFIITQC
jgi:hypothetical protein